MEQFNKLRCLPLLKCQPGFKFVSSLFRDPGQSNIFDQNNNSNSNNKKVCIIQSLFWVCFDPPYNRTFFTKTTTTTTATTTTTKSRHLTEFVLGLFRSPVQSNINNKSLHFSELMLFPQLILPFFILCQIHRDSYRQHKRDSQRQPNSQNCHDTKFSDLPRIYGTLSLPKKDKTTSSSLLEWASLLCKEIS